MNYLQLGTAQSSQSLGLLQKGTGGSRLDFRLRFSLTISSFLVIPSSPSFPFVERHRQNARIKELGDGSAAQGKGGGTRNRERCFTVCIRLRRGPGGFLFCFEITRVEGPRHAKSGALVHQLSLCPFGMPADTLAAAAENINKAHFTTHSI